MFSLMNVPGSLKNSVIPFVKPSHTDLANLVTAVPKVTLNPMIALTRISPTPAIIPNQSMLINKSAIEFPIEAQFTFLKALLNVFKSPKAAPLNVAPKSAQFALLKKLLMLPAIFCPNEVQSMLLTKL